MSNRIGLVQGCVVAAALTGTALVSSGALAQELFAIDPQVYGCCEGGSAFGANAWTNGNYTSAQWPVYGPPAQPYPSPLLTKDRVLLEPVPYWWTHGEVELGFRTFTNDPSRNGPAYLNQQSLAKYYEYSSIAPGVFGSGHVAAGTSDGLYQVDLWANNIAYTDQSYWLDASKAGEHYLSVGWDQTPHVYSTSALTPWLGVGTSALVLGPGFPTGITTSANLLRFLHQQDIAIQRDTASVEYRWTPTEEWDIRADYSHMSRFGSQVAGITLEGFSSIGEPTEIPAPVRDTTQNFGANGEYAGTSWWGQKYTVKVAYTGSQYTDTISSYFVQNPYFPTVSSCTAPTATAAGTPSCVSAQISNPPSNAANGVSGTMAADLPLLSRYVGTVNYTVMTQNDPFQPMTNNPLAVASPFNGGANWNTIGALPTTSLDGRIATLLSNNVLTTKITPDLTSKLTYRYYDFDNQTPRIIFPCWIPFDGTGTPPTPAAPCGPSGFENTISSLTIGYTKQNAGANLNWRPYREWNVNAEYGYERYSYQQADVNATNENSGKVSVDWKPASWFTARASGSYGVRNYETYNYLAFVESIQFPTVPPFVPNTNYFWKYAPAYQQFMFDHRQRTTVNVLFDIVAFHNVTISPSFKFKDDNYGLNPLNQEGVNDSRQTSGGVDVGFVFSPALSFTISYYREYYDQTLYNYTEDSASFPWDAQPGTCAGGSGPLANCLITTSDKERVNTITAVMSWSPIPEALNIVVRYTASKGIDTQRMNTLNQTFFCTDCNGAFPDVTTWFQRLDATMAYKFDRTWLNQCGWTGDLTAKVRYTWEKNSVSDWHYDTLFPFTPAVGGSALFLGYDNPNYNVQMVAASLLASW